MPVLDLGFDINRWRYCKHLSYALFRMDITSYVASERNSGLLLADYNAYRGQATRRVHSLRKRLGQATPRGRKYTPKLPVTADNIQQDNE